MIRWACGLLFRDFRTVPMRATLFPVEFRLLLQQYGYWSHSPETLVAPEEERLEVEFMRERESP